MKQLYIIFVHTWQTCKLRTMMILLLAAFTMGTWAQTYGFMIDYQEVTPSNYQALSNGKCWHYDPSKNVLYLDEGTLGPPSGINAVIYVKSRFNPHLVINVTGNCHVQGRLEFDGQGTHTICGNGTLTLEPQRINERCIESHGSTNLTIKDLTMILKAFGDDGIGFSNIGFSAINLVNCEMYIHGGFAAWYGTSDQNSVTPMFKDCFLKEGSFYNGGVLSGLYFAKETSIERLTINYVNAIVSNPVVGQPLSTTCILQDEDLMQIDEIRWLERIDDTNMLGTMFRTPTSDVFQLGKVYRVVIYLLNKDDNYFHNTEDMTVLINDKPALVTLNNNQRIVFNYTFPQLANTYYDIWVGGKQVNDYNQNDVLGDGGSVKYSKTLGFHSLTLENANITNTGNPDYELTCYGRGIYTTMPNLTIRVKGDNTIESKGEGIYFTGNLSILGITDNLGKLSVKGSYGIRPKRVTEEKTLTIGGVELTAEGTSGAGIGASASFSSGNYNCTMKVGSAKTVVKAKGTSVSLGNLKSLVFEDGLQIVQPSGAYFDDEDVRNTSGIISNQWVVIKYNPSIATGLEAIDNGELTIDNSLPLYNLHGQRVSHPVKGQIYIQNGRKVKF